MSLGEIIRNRREEMKLTLDEVSRRTGFSKPYISTIENSTVKNPPSDDLLVRMEQLLNFEPGLLVRIAHLEKMPADVREEFENHQAENQQWRTLIRHLLEKGELKLPAHMKLPDLDDPRANHTDPVTAGRLIPVINNVSAGYPNDYDDKGYPPGGADDYVRCTDLHDPNAFAVVVVGDSMETKYHEGDIIIFSPAADVAPGDDCFVRMTDPYETTFKRVYFEEDGMIRLQPRNQKYAPAMLPRERITGLWKAVIRYERLME